jgi:hypothetical protein
MILSPTALKWLSFLVLPLALYLAILTWYILRHQPRPGPPRRDIEAGSMYHQSSGVIVTLNHLSEPPVSEPSRPLTPLLPRVPELMVTHPHGVIASPDQSGVAAPPAAHFRLLDRPKTVRKSIMFLPWPGDDDDVFSPRSTLL